MSPEAMNRKLEIWIGQSKYVGLMKQGMWYRANACGYTYCEKEAGRFTRDEAKKHEYLPAGYEWEHVKIVEFSPRDFCFSRDTVAEAEARLSDVPFTDKDGQQWSERCEYMRQLELVVYRDTRVSECNFELYTASAAQRAEALCRALGLWGEDV